MNQSTIIHSARLVDETVTLTDSWVHFKGGKLADRGVGEGWRAILQNTASIAEPTKPVEVTDAAGQLLAPGFIDIHCHGGGGSAVDEGISAIQRVLDTHSAHGTTRTTLSLVTASIADLATQLTSIAKAAANDARIIGAHLEGPFLSPDFRGAHDASLLAQPTPDNVDQLLAAANGTLRQLTIAPELPGAMAAIDQLATAGVAVAVGHTGADYETARSAFDSGASILTHAFNGMRGIHHRAPGPVLSAMQAEHVTIELICDGVHVHPAVISLAFQGAPGRIALITDAMAATDAADGIYKLGSLNVAVKAGVARLADTGSIAGSTLTQDVALRLAVASGVPLHAAVVALTATPAKALGLAHELGRLQPGYAADAVLLDADLNVSAVWVAGVRMA